MSSNNILLAPLVEASLPLPISMFPKTIGWQVLLIVFMVITFYFLYIKIVKWRSNRYRRDAFKQLSSLESLTKQQTIQQLNRILKEAASSAFGEKQVAQLSGDDWLIFLDKTSSCSFISDDAKQWQLAIYDNRSSESISDETVKQLITLSGLWIKKHEVSS